MQIWRDPPRPMPVTEYVNVKITSDEVREAVAYWLRMKGIMTTSVQWLGPTRCKDSRHVYEGNIEYLVVRFSQTRMQP